MNPKRNSALPMNLGALLAGSESRAMIDLTVDDRLSIAEAAKEIRKRNGGQPLSDETARALANCLVQVLTMEAEEYDALTDQQE